MPSNDTERVIDTLKRQAETAEMQPIRIRAHVPQVTASFQQKPTPIDEKIDAEKARKRQIENDNVIRDQKLKETTLKLLFTFLTAETIVIFTFALLQGLNRGFHLDEWSFRVVLSATILQITAMLTIAVQHLFPKKR